MCRRQDLCVAKICPVCQCEQNVQQYRNLFNPIMFPCLQKMCPSPDFRIMCVSLVPPLPPSFVLSLSVSCARVLFLLPPQCPIYKANVRFEKVRTRARALSHFLWVFLCLLFSLAGALPGPLSLWLSFLTPLSVFVSVLVFWPLSLQYWSGT